MKEQSWIKYSSESQNIHLYIVICLEKLAWAIKVYMVTFLTKWSEKTGSPFSEKSWTSSSHIIEKAVSK